MTSSFKRVYRISITSVFVINLTLLILLCPGCISPAGITNNQIRQVQDGELKVLMLHVNARVMDAKSLEAEPDRYNYDPSLSAEFTGKIFNDVCEVYTGNFESGGYLRQCPIILVSEESMKKGWIALLLRGNTQYLSFYQSGHGPATVDNALEGGTGNQRPYYTFRPKWKIQTAVNEHLIYGGTLNLKVYKVDRGFWGTSYVYPGGIDSLTISSNSDIDSETKIKFDELYTDTAAHSIDDQAYAFDLLRQYFPDAGEPVVHIVEPHVPGSPLIFHEPLPEAP